jgi:hypothetical protein
VLLHRPHGGVHLLLGPGADVLNLRFGQKSTKLHIKTTYVQTSTQLTIIG